KYSINTSRTHLKEHTIKCPNSPLMDTQNDAFQQITKEEIDKLIVNLIVRTGMSFNVLENPLFHKMARNLQYIKKSYKVLHPTTISRYISGNIFNLRFNFIKNILTKSSGQISLTCDRWHSTIHKCHYIVITGSWISDNWKIVNIILSFQQSGQTANKILSVIKNTLDEYSIKEKIFALTIDNTTTNKAIKQSNSISNVIIIILEICQHINQTRNNDITYKIKKKFEKYWNVIIDHVIIAYVLDLRYKLNYLKIILIQISRYSESDAELFIDNIQQKIISNRIKFSIAESSNVETVKDNYSSFLFPRKILNKRRHIGTIEYELELYEKEPLEKMVQDYLSIKLLSVFSERIFSKASFTITNDKANISEKAVSSI
ncbi:8437_t:CDS:2, partial [Scutellospora calospora]